MTVPRAVVGALVILIVLATAFFVARGYQESKRAAGQSHSVPQER